MKSIFNNLTVFHNENENKNGVVLFSDTNKIDFQRKYDLFIALWSLSETPLSIRSEFIKIMRNSNYFIVALQGEFYGIDNEVYFKTIKDELKEFEIKFYPINHMNVNYKKGNYYFIGSKKNNLTLFDFSDIHKIIAPKGEYLTHGNRKSSNTIHQLLHQ